MAGSNDFTGQNIQDTYQRVLQLSSSGQLADGTGSLVTLLETTSSFATNAITASHALFAVSASHEVTFEVSSSHAQTADSASYVLASNIDQPFTNITASGNISASGTGFNHFGGNIVTKGVISSSFTGTSANNVFGAGVDIHQELNFLATNELQLEGGNESSFNPFTSSLITNFGPRMTVFLDASGISDDEVFEIRKNNPFYTLATPIFSIDSEGSISQSANITASGGISASSTGSFGSLFLESGHIGIGTNNKYVFTPSSGVGKLEFNVGVSNMSIHSNEHLALTSDDKILELGTPSKIAHVTASGNISASGFISGSKGHIGKVRFQSTHIILNNLSALKAFDNTGTERILAAMNNDESLLASLAHPTKVRGTNIFLGNSGVGAPVTASVFSASGDLIGGGLNINGTTTFNDGNITNVGIIDVDQIRSDTDATTLVAIGNGTISNTVGGANTIVHNATSIQLGTVLNSMHVTASGNISGSSTTNLIIGGFISASSITIDDLTINDDLTVIDDLSIGGTVTVTENINANGNITGDGNTDITGINDIFLDSVVHSGDTDTKIEFNTDKITFTAGSTALLTLTEASLDTIEFGAAISSPITASSNISGSINSTFTAASGSYHILQGDTTQNTGLEIDGFLNATNITASGDVSASGTIIGNTLSLFGLSNQGSEATAVMINGSNVVGTRELGSNAFTSTTIGTTTNALTVDDTTLQLNSGTTFNGSAARTISIKDGGVDSDALAANIAVTQLTASIVSSSGNIIGNQGRFNLVSVDGISTLNTNPNEGLVFADSSVHSLIIGKAGATTRTQIEGNITASGNISSSGNVISLNLTTDSITLEGNRFRIENDNFDIMDGGLEVNGNVTASGDISSSAGSILSVPRRHLDQTAQNTVGSDAQGDIVYFTDGGGSGISTTAGLVYALATNGNLFAVDKDTENISTGLIAVAIGDNSLTDGMLLRGMVKLSHDPFPGGEAALGQPVYVGDNGQLTGSIDGFATDDFIRIAGYELESGGVIYFNPDNTFIKKA